MVSYVVKQNGYLLKDGMVPQGLYVYMGRYDAALASYSLPLHERIMPTPRECIDEHYMVGL